MRPGEAIQFYYYQLYVVQQPKVGQTIAQKHKILLENCLSPKAKTIQQKTVYIFEYAF